MCWKVETTYTLARLGVGLPAIEAVIRNLPAIQRAHEAECSWPDPIASAYAKAGDRAWARLCRAMERWQSGFTLARQGDPRGACVILTVDGVEHRLGAPGFTLAQVGRLDEYRAGAL